MNNIKTLINKLLKTKNLDTNDNTIAQLVKLDLTNNEIKDLREFKELNLNNLVALKLDNNPINTLEGLNGLKKIEYLSLSGCKNIDNFDVLKKLDNLKHLELESCGLKTFKELEFIKGLNSLEELSLKNNNFDNGKEVCLEVFNEYNISKVVVDLDEDNDFIMNDNIFNSGIKWTYIFEQYCLLLDKLGEWDIFK